ncbi:AP2/ERF and B3 domain-containing transcription factor At1g50680-like [Malus sylvestris]|uniref:AP2/ERF and B3 domain-containing transcription factor At1g50680-like n=1 Tax=Malus sylvestris TaxID=3752 RepID=UPI0021AD2B4D|nr:AP2/ERF and B3 domain-containing transcription factor At1g50680-like [Malus sylvestris]
MAEDASIMISSAQRNVGLETSDSNETDFALLHQNKRARHDNDVSFAKFKGVVPQQNGHWGAQIYANHQRIWLGTFKSEKEAAMAYDSAAVKLRNGKDLHRNFPWTNFTIQEPDFQNHYTTEAIIKMIRDGSYPSKFDAFVRSQAQSQIEEMSKGTNPIRVHGDVQVLCRQLFQKELTPSDVGKLNRLVIPKKYAVEYFPCICENVEENVTEDIELVFYDKLMRVWKFRYCYWRSSQSFVFTRGWNRFVKENNLKANDMITFYACESDGQVIREEDRESTTFWLIDVMHSEGESKRSCFVEEANECKDLQVKLELNLGECSSYKFQKGEGKYSEDHRAPIAEEKGIRLFGVNII